jgi:hypothetical protein
MCPKNVTDEEIIIVVPKDPEIEKGPPKIKESDGQLKTFIGMAFGSSVVIAVILYGCFRYVKWYRWKYP